MGALPQLKPTTVARNGKGEKFFAPTCVRMKIWLIFHTKRKLNRFSVHPFSVGAGESHAAALQSQSSRYIYR